MDKILRGKCKWIDVKGVFLKISRNTLYNVEKHTTPNHPLKTTNN
jgi:hypothetical protein